MGYICCYERQLILGFQLLTSNVNGNIGNGFNNVDILNCYCIPVLKERNKMAA